MTTVAHHKRGTRALFIALFLLAFSSMKSVLAQNFYFGADLSYVQEMEDCGVVYKENNIAQDPFALFAAKHHNLVRLRLWETENNYAEYEGD